MIAISRGARIYPGVDIKIFPGQFWDISGTFLFTVYVMTAFGFGAPVPQTLLGRSCALIYAIFAVPMHIYLLVNASTCLVRKVHFCNWMEKKQGNGKSIMEEGIPTKDRKKGSPSYSRNSDMIKTSSYGTIRRNCVSFLRIICGCHGVPLATIFYYTCGAIVFGVLRHRPAVDIIMFPVEFTTTGGLEYVEGHVRILYGLYIEGAMVMFSCSLATLRRRTSNTASYFIDKYRLVQHDV